MTVRVFRPFFAKSGSDGDYQLSEGEFTLEESTVFSDWDPKSGKSLEGVLASVSSHPHSP